MCQNHGMKGSTTTESLTLACNRRRKLLERDRRKTIKGAFHSNSHLPCARHDTRTYQAAVLDAYEGDIIYDLEDFFSCKITPLSPLRKCLVLFKDERSGLS